MNGIAVDDDRRTQMIDGGPSVLYDAVVLLHVSKACRSDASEITTSGVGDLVQPGKALPCS